MKNVKLRVGLMAALTISAIAAWAVAQQTKDTGVATKSTAEKSRYMVSSATDSVLVDETSGKTWVLTNAEDDELNPVWLPVKRIDSEEEAAKWKEQNGKKKADKEGPQASIPRKLHLN